MVLIFACLLHPIALTLIGGKWSDCYWELRMVLISACLFHPVVLSFIESMWSDYY